MKQRKQTVLAVVLCSFGIVLIIAAFMVPPVGVIDSSVLTAYGETLTFAGAVIGIDSKYRGGNPPQVNNQ